jgi:hypothetical protein
MKKNVGQLDRLIRLVLGVALLSLFFLIEGDLKWVSLMGFVLIVTALINFCPLYLPFGINTRTLKK